MPIVGELATGNLPKRSQTLEQLLAMEIVPAATERETLVLVESQKLFGKGLSWNDIQLLAACLIGHVPLWTKDKRLKREADRLGCGWEV